MEIHSKNVLPYVNDIIGQLDNDFNGRNYVRYSSEWVNASLDEERLKDKYGKDWNKMPPDLQDYYRAQGYYSAVYKIAHLNNGISCDISEMISQEILMELDKIIQTTIGRYLN